MRYIIPWLIIIISIIVIKYNDKIKNKYLIYFLLLGSSIGGILGVILKYIIKTKVDIGLYILIGCFVGELLGMIIKKKC